MYKHVLPIFISLLFSTTVFGASGIFQTYIIYTVDGMDITRGGALNPGSLPDFDGSVMATDPGTLTLRGGEVQTFKNGSSDVTGATFYYRVYRIGSTPPSFTAINLPFRENCNVGEGIFPTGGPCSNSGDQKWNTLDAAIDLLSVVDQNGTYQVDAYWEASTNIDGTLSDGNSSDFVSGTFEITLLPVELVSFKASHQSDHIHLQWTTTSEVNNDYFEVEKSTDGRTWSAIGQVNGHGTSIHLRHYHFKDFDLLSGSLYYRLRQVDFDGRFDYSPVVTILSQNSNSISVFPNPIRNGIININLSDITGEYNLLLVNSFGQTVAQQKITILENDLLSWHPGKIPAGIYHLILRQHGLQWQTKIFIK